MNESKDSHEFVLVHMLEPVELGTQFTMWPLHMTLLPWFNAPSAEVVRKELVRALEAIKSLSLKIGEKEFFGQRKLPVRLVVNTSELQNLHSALLKMVDENGWNLQGRYTGGHFKPHVTNKSGKQAEDELRVYSVYVFEKMPHGYRKAVAKVDLA